MSGSTVGGGTTSLVPSWGLVRTSTPRVLSVSTRTGMKEEGLLGQFVSSGKRPLLSPPYLASTFWGGVEKGPPHITFKVRENLLDSCILITTETESETRSKLLDLYRKREDTDFSLCQKIYGVGLVVRCGGIPRDPDWSSPDTSLRRESRTPKSLLFVVSEIPLTDLHKPTTHSNSIIGLLHWSSGRLSGTKSTRET